MTLKERMNKEIVPELCKQWSVPALALPCIKKVTVNTGVGRIKESKEELENIVRELTKITGQKPKSNAAKKSISTFKLRKGQVVGYSVTLRGNRMYDFLERLINIVLPRSREFEGIRYKSFDRSNNLTIALKEQNIFPEIRADDIKQAWGMSITVSINNAKNRENVVEYLRKIGFVFEKEQ